MRRLWSSERVLALAGVAFAGMVGAHEVAYVVASPDPHARAHLLERTGHAAWPLVVAAALAVLVAGLGSLMCCRRPAAPQPGLSRLWPRLWLLQSGAFLVLEAAERAGNGHLSGGLLSEPAVVVGIVLQVVVSLVGALLLTVVERVAAGRGAGPPVRPLLRSWPLPCLPPIRLTAPVTGGRGPRSPPAV